MSSHLQQVAMLLASQAQQDGGGASGCAAGGSNMLLMVIMLGILYFVWIRPASTERKKQQQMLEQLKRGDEVITSSGMFGTITDMDDRTITLEVARNVKVKFLRSAVLKPAAETTTTKADESDKSSSKATKS